MTGVTTQGRHPVRRGRATQCRGCGGGVGTASRPSLTTAQKSIASMHGADVGDIGGGTLVQLYDEHHRVPADDVAKALFDIVAAGIGWLAVSWDRID